MKVNAYLLYSLIFLMACNFIQKANNKKYMNIFDKQGHRGCRGLMPENTVPAFLKAIDLNVTTLEMDVVITKDEKVLVSHEPFFNHEITTKQNGDTVLENEEKTLNIYKMNFDETQHYDVGMKNHPRFLNQQKVKVTKPLLQKVIDEVVIKCKNEKKQVPFFNIETKCLPSTDNIYHPIPDVFVKLLMDVIIKNKIQEQVIIQSFDFRTLQYLHNNYPTIKTAALIEESDKLCLEEQINKLNFTPTIYSPNYNLVNKELLLKCAERNIKLIPWTVNNKSKIEELRNMGVHGIITDYPNLF